MNLAVVVSGQGHQHAGMLPWLADGPWRHDLQHRLGVADWRAALADAAWASTNANAQMVLTGTALAAWQALAPRLPQPVGVAGYSVGELAAFSIAGVFDPPTALALAHRRALEMDRCAAAGPGGLVAVVGLQGEALARLQAETGLHLAIRNGVDSVVLGGPVPALDRGDALAHALGGRTTRLPVAIASHTPAMQAAAQRFAGHLATQPLCRPGPCLFSNAAGRVRTAAEAAAALAAQMAQTVRWDDTMDDLRSRNPSCVLEIGGGQALARLWNQRHPDVPARSVDEFRSADAIVAWVGHRS